MAKKRKTKSTKKSAAKRTIGILHSGSPGNHDHDETIKALKDALSTAGFNQSNVNFEPRFADDDPGNLQQFADELVKTVKVDVLVAAGGTRAADEAERASNDVQPPVPVVFTSVADNTRRPDNMTGVCAQTSPLDSERLKLANELMPTSTIIGALTNPLRPNFQAEWLALASTAATLNVTLSRQDVSSPHSPAIGQVNNAIDQAFKNFSQAGIRPVVVTADPLFNNHRRAIVAAAKKYKIPAIYQWRQFAAIGGLMSYGTKLKQAYQVAGSYVALILNGTKTSDIDVLELNPELVINLKTAKALGISIPPTLLARADELIS